MCASQKGEGRGEAVREEGDGSRAAVIVGVRRSRERRKGRCGAQPFRKSDVESGARPLYPMMLESPELRWSFIRKVYSIIAIQLLATIAVVTVRPNSTFFATTGAGLALYIVLIFVPFVTLCPLYYYYQKHPVNYLLLGIFTLSLSFEVGLSCAFTRGKSRHEVWCCGPVLIEKLNEEIQLRGLKDQISVMACSHVGGHKYAGNLIVFIPRPDGKIMGHWYGYVTPNDVPALLDQHRVYRTIIQRVESTGFQ